jgi:poly(A) polymerase
MPGSRKPQVRFGRTLLEDLSRRDFTINAIAEDPASGDLIDPAGGAADLAAGMIRSVGSPEERFREDPLRLLRAIRFATRYSFEIEAETWRAMRESAGTLQSISRERIRDEWSKILTGPSPDRGLTLLRDSGLLAASVPQLLELTRMPDHGPRHPLSLWDHTMRVVSAVPSLLVLRWAALLHDIAKPATRVHELDGRPRFFHHEEVGADMARQVLGGLHYSNSEIADVALLVETHMHLHAYTDAWSDGAVRRLTLRLRSLTQPAILLARADASGHTIGNAPSANAPKFDRLEERIRALDGPKEVLRSPLTGDDLMRRYDRPPGPWIRLIKDALLDEVIEGRLGPDDRDRALAIADRLISDA